MSVSPHWFQDVHAHLVAATTSAGFVEVFPDFDVFNFGRLLAESLVVRQGRVELPTSPGLGITFDADAVDRFAVAPWS